MRISKRQFIILGLIVSLFIVACKVYLPPLSKQYLGLLKQGEITSDRVRYNCIYRQVLPKYHIPEQWKAGKPINYIDKPYLDHPLILFSDGKVYYDAHVWRDSSLFAETFYWSKQNIEATGVYEIAEDTIKAIVYVNFQCNFRFNFHFYGLSKLRECHFTGIIKNKDTILQWHMAPDLTGIHTNYIVNRLLY